MGYHPRLVNVIDNLQRLSTLPMFMSEKDYNIIRIQRNFFKLSSTPPTSTEKELLKNFTRSMIHEVQIISPVDKKQTKKFFMNVDTEFKFATCSLSRKENPCRLNFVLFCRIEKLEININFSDRNLVGLVRCLFGFKEIIFGFETLKSTSFLGIRKENFSSNTKFSFCANQDKYAKNRTEIQKKSRKIFKPLNYGERNFSKCVRALALIDPEVLKQCINFDHEEQIGYKFINKQSFKRVSAAYLSQEATKELTIGGLPLDVMEVYNVLGN